MSPLSRRALLRIGCALASASVAGCTERNPTGSPTATGTTSETPTGSEGPSSTPAEEPTPTHEAIRWQHRTGTVSKDDLPATVSSCLNCAGRAYRPTVFEGTVLTGGDRLYGLDAATGREQWSGAIGPPTQPWWLVHDGTAYVQAGYQDHFVCDSCTIAAIDLSDGTVRWRFSVDETVMNLDPLAATDDTLYVGTSNDDVIGDEGSYTYAVDAETGEERWRVHTRDPGPATVVDETVYVSAWNRFFAIDATTGEVRWRYHQPPNDGFTVAPSVRSVFFDTSDPDTGTGDVVALDLETGEERWRYRPDDAPALSFALVDDTLVVTPPMYDTPALYAVDAATGEERWAYHLGESPTETTTTESTAEEERQVGQPVVVPKLAATTSELALVQDGSKLHAVALADGIRRWEAEVDIGEFGPRLTVADGLLFAHSDGEVVAIRIDDGTMIWRSPVDISGRTSQSVWSVHAGDGSVLLRVGVPGADGTEHTLIVLSRDSGEERWRFAPGGRLSEPTVVGDTAYVGSDAPALFALEI